MNNCHPKKLGRCLRFSFCLLPLCFFLITGCQTKNTRDDKADFAERDAAVARDSVLNSIRASDLTSHLRFNAEVFNKGLLHDADRINDYIRRGKGAAAANLGIYLSDLSCLVALDKREEARRYFEVCHRLSEFVGMEKQFEQAIQFGFNEIIAGNTGLEKSLEHQFKDASNTTQQEEFKKLHASALTGYYIEELYHLASFLKSQDSISGGDSVFFVALKVFVNQKDELDNLITYFDHVKLKPEGISAYQDLLALQAKYLALDRDRLLRETNPSLVLEDKSLQDIFDSLIAFRKRIIDS